MSQMTLECVVSHMTYIYLRVVSMEREGGGYVK